MVLLRILLVYANIIGQRLEERRKVGMPEIAPPLFFENKTAFDQRNDIALTCVDQPDNFIRLLSDDFAHAWKWWRPRIKFVILHGLAYRVHACTPDEYSEHQGNPHLLLARGGSNDKTLHIGERLEASVWKLSLLALVVMLTDFVQQHLSLA